MAGTQNTIIDTVTTDTACFYEVKLPGSGRPAYNPAYNHQTQFKVFPNPNRGDIQIDFRSESEGKVSLVIFDLNGKTLFKESKEAVRGFNRWNVHVKNTTKGVYLVRLVSLNTTYTQKITVH